ncbi:FapA family protein [Shewanella oncorhynchi]|uniref:FapA family protein n=2 Tax=Shewanella TaxID=22 RepID=A0AA50KF72_9GAMM|nr:FapA family protein [Shewanella oncorhynchi]WMB73789.1 FapA family protein [Shewanella oncorhynchi]
MLDPELIELNSDKTKAELRLIPNVHGPVTHEDIMRLLSLPEFAALFPLEPAITKTVAKINSLCNQDDGKFELYTTLAERRDGSIAIEISPDKMQASLKLTAAWGGKQIDLPEILTHLKKNNVCMGLSKLKIQALLKQLSTLKPGEICQSEIAQGKAPVNGLNAVLERKVFLARERLLQPQEREDGSVDMRNLGAMIVVKANDLLMVKHLATEGTPGYNIKGEVLKQKPGKDAVLQVGTGTAFHPKDPNKLIATVPGQPVETRTGMNVDDVLQLKDVDISTGHVTFKGSILITGDVHEGMIVKSSGDITVMGFVDSATLEAEGDVTVSKGIIGRQIKANEYSTNIYSQGQISAQFVQYSQLVAKGNILVTKQLLHSNTKTAGSLTVSDPSGRRGDLVGGVAHAEKGITAVVIGATAGTKTDVYCAMGQAELKQDLKLLDESVKAMVVASLDIEARLNKLPPKSEWQADAVMIEQIKMMLDEKNRIMDERTREELEFDTFKQEVEGYYEKYRIEVLKHVFLNVELHIGPANHRTAREHGTCCIANVNQEINFDYNAKAKAAPSI